MDLKEIDILGADIEKHWYYRSKARAMMCLLDAVKPSMVLDVGAGSGFFSRHILANSAAKEAVCIDTSYPVNSESTEGGKPIYFKRSTGTTEADLVLLMDVLEHVDDDIKLLKEYVDKVPSGSLFLISVPAFQLLWSSHDDFLDHKRRYTIRQLEKIAVESGLRVKSGSYYFGLVLPIAAITRLVNKFSGNKRPARSQLNRHHPFINNMLGLFCRLELKFLKHNRLAGLTAFCLAEKA